MATHAITKMLWESYRATTMFLLVPQNNPDTLFLSHIAALAVKTELPESTNSIAILILDLALSRTAYRSQIMVTTGDATEGPVSQ